MRGSAADRDQSFGAGRSLAGQEPLEHEPSRRQPADHQRGQRRRRARDDLDRVPGRHGRGDQPLAGSDTPGMPASDTSTTRSPRSRRSSRRGVSAHLGVLVHDHERAPLDAGERQELARAAGVLAAHDVGRGQRLGRPGREVAEVPDRRADEHEPARSRSPLDLELVAHLQPPSPEGARFGLDDRPRPPHEAGQAVAGHGHDPQHAQVAVAERHVDGEPHAHRVDRPARAQQQRAVDAVAAEEAPRPGSPVAGDLEARQHFAVTQQPGHGSP